jgi:hypothetical protein
MSVERGVAGGYGRSIVDRLQGVAPAFNQQSRVLQCHMVALNGNIDKVVDISTEGIDGITCVTLPLRKNVRSEVERAGVPTREFATILICR